MSSKALKDKLAKQVALGRDLIEQREKDGNDLAAEDREKIDRINLDAKTILAQIASEEELERIALASAQPIEPFVAQPKVDDRPAISDESRRLGISAWLLNQGRTAGSISAAHRDAAAKIGLDLASNEIVVRFPTGTVRPWTPKAERISQITNTLGTAPDTAGGYFVGESMAASIEIALLAFSGVLQAATVITTAQGEDLRMPTTNDTSNKAAQIGENVAESTTSVDPTIGNMTLRAYLYSSKFIRVSNTELRDSAYDLGSLIGTLLGERHGRRINTDGTTGTGAAGPTGIVTASTLGVTTAGATAITFDEIIDLKHSVDPAYRGPGSGFMMSDTVFLYVSKLKASGTGEYLLQPDATQAVGFRAHGHPIFINTDMAAGNPIVTATKTVLFGDLSKFIVRRVAGIRLLRVAERFVEFDQTAFIAFLSWDSGLLNAGTNPVKHMLQA